MHASLAGSPVRESRRSAGRIELAQAVEEGRVPFAEYNVWYRIIGEPREPGKPPLLCLHGGPGAPHDYLMPLEALAKDGRRVIFYDQLGCGNSDQPSDPSLWTVERFVDGVDAIRDALALDRVHLLGHSWGGMLALEYALTRPTGLASLILASTTASTHQWIAEADRLRADLPPEVQEVLLYHEATATTDDPAYQEAMMAFYERHVCRLAEWPEFVTRTFNRLRHEVYGTMWGPSEFHSTGALREWDVRDRLGEIDVPTLVTSGRYDEATPHIAETLKRGIPVAQVVIFEQSAHMAHAEEPERYRQEIEDFLTRVEFALS
jgi:proline-specific peptidase